MTTSTTTPVALITGAGSGIGCALSRLLANEGWAIAGVDIVEAGVRALGNDLQAAGKRCAWRVADVTDAAGLLQATRELEAEVGPIDLLVANAGIGLETGGLNYNTADMNRVINVNLIGVSNSIGAVLPCMLQRRRGHIVGISSVASYRGLPRMLAYCAAKAGVNAIMDGLRVELMGTGVDVTTVCPGWVRTPLTAKLEGELEHLLDVDAAAKEIAHAIRRKMAFYTFPRPMRWKMNFMSCLPRSWQDAMIRRLMNRIVLKEKKETLQAPP